VLNPSRVEKSVNDDDDSVFGLCRVDDVACCCSMGVWHSTCSTINVRQERRKETSNGQERGARLRMV